MNCKLFVMGNYNNSFYLKPTTIRISFYSKYVRTRRCIWRLISAKAMRVNSLPRAATRWCVVWQPATGVEHVMSCADADDKLFGNVLFNDLHLLHHLLPSPRDNHYNLRSQTNHNLQLPLRTCSLNAWNFFMRLLFKDLNYSAAS